MDLASQLLALPQVASFVPRQVYVEARVAMAALMPQRARSSALAAVLEMSFIESFEFSHFAFRLEVAAPRILQHAGAGSSAINIGNTGDYNPAVMVA